MGIVINTASCDSAGVHWVALCIDHRNCTVELFDSTGEYKKELQPVTGFARFLVAECSSIFNRPYKLLLQDAPVQ